MPGIAIYGTGGFAREVLGPLKAMLSHSSQADDLALISFIDDNTAHQGIKVNGLDVLSYEQARADGYSICIAIADGKTRQNKAEIVAKDGLAFISIKASTCIRYDNVAIGVGAILCDHVVLTGDAQIGDHFQANIYSYVAHDCVIGNFVTFAPRVSCNGNVTIGDGAYIGTGALLKQGVTIGEMAVIGMGAVVTKDVAPGTVVVGNPARQLTR